MQHHDVAIVHLEIISRNPLKWGVRRLVDSPLIPSEDILIKHVSEMDSFCREKSVTVDADIHGFAVRSGEGQRATYIVLWRSLCTTPRSVESYSQEDIEDVDVLARAFLLLMRDKDIGRQLASLLAESSLIRKTSITVHKEINDSFHKQLQKMLQKLRDPLLERMVTDFVQFKPK